MTLVRTRSLPNWRIFPEGKTTLLGRASWREPVRPCSPDERWLPAADAAYVSAACHIHHGLLLVLDLRPS